MDFKKIIKNYDFVLLLLVCILISIGLIILNSISQTRTGVGQLLFSRQRLFFFTGLVVLFIASILDYKFICKFYIPLYILNIILLIVVMLIPNSAANENTNTARWINVGNILTIQPSEFSKLFLTIFVAKFVDVHKETIDHVSTLFILSILVLVPTILILLQPSLSASLVSVVMVFFVLFMAKVNIKYFLILFSLVIGFLGIFFIDIKFNDKAITKQLIKSKIIKEYHINRVEAFLIKDPTSDLYRQTDSSVSAIGSGKLNGKGLFKGTTKKLGFIANNENDFIFSVVGEEFGFLGSIFTLCLMFFIILKSLIIANKSNSNLAKLFICGVVGMFAFQTFINVCVATGIAPNTGMPFPFLSYGGSSLWVNMALIGIVMNISLDKPKSIFEG